VSSEPNGRRVAVARWAGVLLQVVAMAALVAAVQAAWTIARPRHPDDLSLVADLPQVPDVVGMSGQFMDELALVPGWLRLLSVLPGVAMAVAHAVSAVLIARVLRDVGLRTSFSARAQRDVRVVGLTLVATAVAAGLVDGVAGRLIDALVRGQGIVFAVEPPSLPVLSLVLGLVAIAFSYVVRDGAALEREAAGVI
jgi:hypothetical protein